MSALEHRQKLAERANELAKLLNDEAATLAEIYKRWDSDGMADEDIGGPYAAAHFTGPARDRVYPNVAGIWTYRDSFLTELKQAREAAERLRERLLGIVRGVEE